MAVMRSIMYVPGNNPKMVEKAPSIPADIITLDLEDSVPPSEKEAARKLVAEKLKYAGSGGAQVYVRINNWETEMTNDDLEAVVWEGLDGVTLAKPGHPDDVKRLDWKLEELERRRGIPVGTVKISMLLETAKGIMNAYECCMASSRNVNAIFGAVDYCRDMRVKLTSEAVEQMWGRAKMAIAARAAGIVAIDAPFVAYQDIPAFERNVMEGKQMGYEGRMIIHPSQVEPSNRLYAPDPADVEWANGVVKVFEEEGLAKGKAAVSYLGMMGTKYGETEKAVAAYVGTQKEVDDAVAKAKKEGGVWTQYLSKETAEAAATALRRLDGAFDTPVKGADGSALSFLDNRYAARAYQGVSEEAMRAYARQHPMSIDPDFEDRMVAYMKRYESERMNAYTTEHQNAVNTACSEYEQNGQISAQTLMRLTTKERVAVRKYCQELDAGGFTTSTHYAAYLDTHLDELGNFTKDELDNAMRLVPKASQRRFRKEWERRHGQTQEQLEARYAAQNGMVTLGKTGVHVGMTMKALGDLLPGFKKLDTDQKATIAEGIMNLAGLAAAIEGVDLKDANKAQQFVTDLVKDNVYTAGHWYDWLPWITKDRKSVFEFKYGDLGSEQKWIADELAKLSGNDRKMTPGQRMGNLVNFMLLKNVNIPVGSIAQQPRVRNKVYQLVDQDMQRDPKYAGMSPAQRRALIEPAMKNDTEVVRQYLTHLFTEGE